MAKIKNWDLYEDTPEMRTWLHANRRATVDLINLGVQGYKVEYLLRDEPWGEVVFEETIAMEPSNQSAYSEAVDWMKRHPQEVVD